jgi:hypothetical protein
MSVNRNMSRVLCATTYDDVKCQKTYDYSLQYWSNNFRKVETYMCERGKKGWAALVVNPGGKEGPSAKEVLGLAFFEGTGCIVANEKLIILTWAAYRTAYNYDPVCVDC